MASESLQKAQQQIDQYKRELDEVNPKLNRVQAQLAESESERLVLQEKLDKANQQLADVALERGKLATASRDLLAKVREQEAQIATLKGGVRQAEAQLGVALRRDARARQFISGVIRSGMDLLQASQAVAEVEAAGAAAAASGG